MRPRFEGAFAKRAAVVASLWWCLARPAVGLSSRRRVLPGGLRATPQHGVSTTGGAPGCFFPRRHPRHRDVFAALRGGAIDEDDDEALFEEEEEALSEADFEGETLKARVLKSWRTTPPMTQAYVGASLALTTLVFLLGANVWPDALHFELRPTLLRLQLWRPATAFLYYGPFGVSYLLTIHFVWTYMGTLEKLAHQEPWEFAIMLGFGAALLLAGVGIAGLNAKFLAHNLSCFLVYIWARTYEGQEVNVMEFFNIKAELLPWFFAAQTYLLEHELPVHDLLGIAIGHLYVWMRQRDALHAPGWLVDAFKSRPELMAKYAAMADEFGEKDDTDSMSAESSTPDEDDDEEEDDDDEESDEAEEDDD